MERLDTRTNVTNTLNSHNQQPLVPQLHTNKWVDLKTLDTTGPYPIYDLLDTDAKRLLRATIADCLTDEIREQCHGLKVLVLSPDEYGVMMNALEETSKRKRLQRLNAAKK